MSAAVAAAETGSDGAGAGAGAKSTQNSKPQDGTGATPDAGSPSPAKPVPNVGDLLRTQVQNGLAGIASTMNSLPKPGLPTAGSFKTPKTTFGGSPTVHGSVPAASSGSVTPNPLSSAGDAAAGAASAAGGALSSAVGAAGQAATSAVGAAGQTVSAAAGAAGQAASTAAGAAGQAATNAALAANDAISTAAETVAVPVAQVVTSVQSMLSSVAGAGAALGQLPADLSDLLGVDGAIPATDGTGSTRALPDAMTAPVTGTGEQPTATLPALPGMANLPGAIPSTTPVLPIRYTAAQANEAAAAAAPSTGENAAGDVLSMVEHVIGAVVASVSLTALLAVALPGLGALVGACAAGIRVGYRQAKAGAELPGTAISRFVGSGPVGVVRSGSQIAWRPRMARPELRRPAAARTLRIVSSAPESAELLDHAV
ncbi:hypothetical protein H7I40_02630 [Mycolicibacterium madagascariense]|nr:hypothetical protein [Mycolicibacterium madagascariense]